MSLRVLPPRVRALLYLCWAGAVLAGLGVIGFFLSFWQVGSSAQAAIDVHRTVPVLAYASILAWVVGLAAMWWGRRRVDAALAAKLQENRDAALADIGPALADAGLRTATPVDSPVDDPDGHEG